MEDNKFIDNGNGTITDTVTGLMWQKAGELTTGREAVKYVETLTLGGYSDWRIPTFNELKLLRKNTKKKKTERDTVVQHIRESLYWADGTLRRSTSYGWSSDFALTVNFNNGEIVEYPVACRCYVRAVRGGGNNS